MQNTTKDGSSMVGMEQCRIQSSIESNTSGSLLEGGSAAAVTRNQTAVPASTTAELSSQKSRESHSSGSVEESCEGATEESIILSGGTEAEPLLPVSSHMQGNEEDEEEKEGITAHVNKLHFELFDQGHGRCTRDDKRKCIMGPEISEIEKNEEGSCSVTTLDESFLGGSRNKESIAMLAQGTQPLHEKNISQGESTKMKNGSNDTVCTSSSSSSATTTITATIASSNSNKSSKSGNNKLGRNKNKRLRHLSTDTDDTSDISATLEPPDGGWGWVVVAASFLVNLIADGVTFSFGVFFMEFQNFFNESESTTAWIGSLLAAMPLLSGPIASWLTDRYGCRNVTIVGGLLAALGFGLSSYATSIYVLMFTFGVLTGFGLSLCYVAAVVIVAYYFERRRSFATGLSVCGGGIGTFLFAPICQYLIDWYGWQRTTLILAGAFLSLTTCGLLMKDLEWTKKKNKSSNNNNSNSNQHQQHHHNLNNLSNHVGCGGNHLHNHHHHYQINSNKSSMTLMLNNKNNRNRRCNSAICIPTFVQEQERRERRQRYYSCNQDSEGGKVGVKPPDAVIMDRSSSPARSIVKPCTNKIKTVIKTKDVLLLPTSTNSNCDDDEDLLHDNDDLPDLSIENGCPNGRLDPIIPENGQLEIIPNGKDKLFNNQTNGLPIPTTNSINNNSLLIANNKINNSASCNGEIVGIAQQSLMNSLSIIDAPPLPPPYDTMTTSASNYHHPHIHFDPETLSRKSNSTTDESNNSSINNLQFNNINNIGNTGVNGIVRNNSFRNKNNNFSNFSSTATSTAASNNNNNSTSITTTIMPTGTGAALTPNGIPTIIIPPAQQMKQSVNSNNFSSSTNNNNNNTKLDIMSGARYRSVMHRHSLTYRGAVLNLKRYRLRPASSCPDIISVATSVDGRGSFEIVNVAGDFSRWIRGVCEWENLVNTRFLLFILSNLLLYTWYDVPYMYLQTAAVKHGYSEDLSSYLISSIGLSNVVGNVMLGYLGDKEWASATCVYGVCMIICGGTTVLMPYLMEWSYLSLFIICGVFGLTIAANYALTSVILVQVVSLERFANAYGLLLLVQGIGNLVGPPIAGVISDATGTNTWSFLVAGIGIFASSFFVLAPVFQRELHLEQNSNSNNDTRVAHHNPV